MLLRSRLVLHSTSERLRVHPLLPTSPATPRPPGHFFRLARLRCTSNQPPCQKWIQRAEQDRTLARSREGRPRVYQKLNRGFHCNSRFVTVTGTTFPRGLANSRNHGREISAPASAELAAEQKLSQQLGRCRESGCFLSSRITA